MVKLCIAHTTSALPKYNTIWAANRLFPRRLEQLADLFECIHALREPRQERENMEQAIVLSHVRTAQTQ